MLSTRTTFPFTVTRHEPELVAPAKATPRGLKPLSDIDDQQSLRILVPLMIFYPGKVGDGLIGDVARDPVRVIREALAEALVYYYPLVGRLRESGPEGKLLVDCTGEGVLFVEADAGYTVEDLLGEGEFLRPPFPCELQYDVPTASSGILHCPLLFIQVTRFICGGFSFAMHMNQTMSDAAGLVQFMNCVAELARGESRPSVQPVWSHELLLTQDPPRVTCTHHEYRQVDGPAFPLQYINDRIIERSFFFGPAELSAIRRLLQPHLRRCNTIDLLSAFLWRCRTVALRFDLREEVRYMCLVNVQPKLKTPRRADYYDNAFVVPVATSTAGELSENRLDYAVELIKKAKAEVTEEYMRPVTNLMATSGKPHITMSGAWIVSDNMRAGHLEIDFGWGKPEFGGPSSAMVGSMPGLIGFFVKGVNGVGESGVFLLICLPIIAMERFAREVRSTTVTSRL